jgi:hypothetical protein
VIAVGKETSTSRNSAIDGPGDAHRETLHAERERAPAQRFHDQMKVIALHAEVHETKTEALSTSGQRHSHIVEQSFFT